MSRLARVLLATLLALPACGKDEKEDPKEGGAQSADQQKKDEAAPPRGVASKNGVYRIDVEWLSGPDFENEDNRCRLVFLTADGKPATDTVVLDFRPWMTSMGHGAPMIDLALNLEEGRSDAMLVQGLMFTMGGAWDLKIDAKIDGQRDQAVFPVDVPKK